MEQLIFDVFVQALALWAAYKFGQHVAAMRITRMLIERDPDVERAIETARKEIREAEAKAQIKTEELTVERHGDQLYIYTKHNDEFLGQGANLDEALDNIAKRFPGREFRGLLTKEQAEQLGVSAKQG